MFRPLCCLSGYKTHLLAALLVTSVLLGTAQRGSAQCTPNPANNTLTICTPLNNQTVSSPFTVSAVATSSTSVTKFLVYLDSVLKFQQLNTSSISTSISAGTGTHNLTVQYYNGAWIKATNFITVGIRFRNYRDGQPELCNRNHRRNATIHSCGYGYYPIPR